MSEIKVFKIKKIKEENPNMKTFTFNGDLEAKPGQFVMVWIPGADQKPFGISRQTKNEFDVSVLLRGKFTKAMFELRAGEKCGISGPFGTHFTLAKSKKVAVVGGGCGMAPLGFLIDELKMNECEVIVYNGARSKDNILFADRFKDSQFCTGDATLGHEGHATDVLREQMGKLGPAMVYSCGPEMMMRVVTEICAAHDVPCEVSMERYMKCGFGVCGQCVMDPLGIRMCQEGPVLSCELTKRLSEFGKYYRDKSGKKVDF